MKRRGFRRIHYAFMFVALALTVGGCAHSEKAYMPAGPVECDSKIVWEVAPEAAVTAFKCYLDMYDKKYESVHYAITVKNISDKPQRYRVNIFMPEERAVGGLLPRKGKPPVVKPGEETSFTYPVKNYNKIPKKIDVIVRTIAVE